MNEPVLELRMSGGPALDIDVFAVYPDGRSVFTKEGARNLAVLDSLTLDDLISLAEKTLAVPANERLAQACASCDNTLHEVYYRDALLIRTTGLTSDVAETLLDRLEALAEQTLVVPG